jgi:integrase
VDASSAGAKLLILPLSGAKLQDSGSKTNSVDFKVSSDEMLLSFVQTGEREALAWLFRRYACILHEQVKKNPVMHVETRCKSNYRAIVITPAQTFNILKSLKNHLHHTLVLTCAATALRSSEILALRWADILWLEERIRVSKRWANGKDGETKTEASDGYVPLHPVLANHLQQWRCQTPHKKDTNFVFPSFKARGRVPLSSSIFVSDYLRPAAKAAGVQIEDGQRFGLHNLRHSLSNWLVNKAKVEPKTVQGILRHSRIQTTLDLYTQEDSDEARGAQGEFLKAVGIHSGMTQ